MFEKRQASHGASSGSLDTALLQKQNIKNKRQTCDKYVKTVKSFALVASVRGIDYGYPEDFTNVKQNIMFLR